MEQFFCSFVLQKKTSAHVDDTGSIITVTLKGQVGVQKETSSYSKNLILALRLISQKISMQIIDSIENRVYEMDYFLRFFSSLCV